MRKQNVSEREKYHESDLLWSTDIWFTNYKRQHPGFSECVKILGAQMKKKPQKIAISNSVKQNVSEGENWR